jgi:hypothetical protein
MASRYSGRSNNEAVGPMHAAGAGTTPQLGDGAPKTSPSNEQGSHDGVDPLRGSAHLTRLVAALM